MSWRENELVLEALAVQGYFDEETNTLLQEPLAASLRDVYLRAPMLASADEYLERKARFFKQGYTKFEIVDKILPGFREGHELSDEEQALLRKDAKNHPDLEERAKAITDVVTLLWGTLSKTGRSGAVQMLLVQRQLLLVEAKATRDGSAATVKAATDDQDLIIEFYVRPRGDQLVKISGGVRDDCTMVGMAFEGINDRMKRELGGHVNTAIGQLLQVATPDLAALGAGVSRQQKSLSSPAKV